LATIARRFTTIEEVMGSEMHRTALHDLLSALQAKTLTSGAGVVACPQL
jgi:hypothetical protein